MLCFATMYRSIDQTKGLSVGLLVASGLAVTAVLIQLDKTVGRKLKRDRKHYSVNERKFPWEPLDSTVKRDIIDAFKVEHSQELSSQEQHHQLRFLASMTFSNGGIRSPSCPCCQ